MSNITYTRIAKIFFCGALFSIFPHCTRDLHAMHESEMEDTDLTPDGQLQRALSEDNFELATTAITLGHADVNRTSDNITPLLQAMNNLSPDMFELLLIYKADPNQKNEDNSRTVLHEAALYDDASYLKLSLQFGADVNAVDEDGNTPLHRVTYPLSYGYNYKTADICNVGLKASLLMHAKADLNAKNNNNMTPLDQCIRYPLLGSILFHAYAEQQQRQEEKEQEDEDQEEDESDQERD